jgi:hypothetical protein
MKFNFKNFRFGDFLSKRINTILLIVILIIILTGHVVCSCSRMSASKVIEKLTSMNSTASSSSSSTDDKKKKIAIAKIAKNLPNPVKKAIYENKKQKEGFTGATTNNGQSAPYLLGSLGGTATLDTNSWNQQDLVVKCDGSYGKGVADILGRPSQQIPLKDGELDIFATTPFKPECCPNFYSNSMGCACMTTNQYNYMVSRGGNNTPYSEY